MDYGETTERDIPCGYYIGSTELKMLLASCGLPLPKRLCLLDGGWFRHCGRAAADDDQDSVRSCILRLDPQKGKRLCHEVVLSVR